MEVPVAAPAVVAAAGVVLYCCGRQNSGTTTLFLDCGELWRVLLHTGSL